MEDYKKVRASVLSVVKDNLTPVSFTTWFEPLQINKIDDNIHIAYLTTEDAFVRKIIKDRYIPLLENAFKQVLNTDYRVVIQEKEDVENSKQSTKKETPKSKVNYDNIEKIFDPRFTFDNFVVGDSNKYAHAAALAVAESPSETFNPLFLYGGSGLGKTHLMHAIGIYLLENNKKMNVLYVSSEMFTNEFIKALQNNTLQDFKNKYRNVDVLLIDDIQFFEKKSQLQEEFFHTFNSLYDLNKQIVISSDKSPNKLDLTERLRTRFAWNLVADIQPADYETRVAILMKWAENEGLEVNDEVYEVFSLVADKIKTNIRELEGAFKRIVSFSKFLGEKIDVPFAKRILKEIMITGDESVTPEKIKKTVSKQFNIKITEIESNKKTNDIAFARQVAMYLCRYMTDYSFVKIGQLFGNRHHSTVMHACEKLQTQIESNESIAELVENLKNKVRE